MSKVVVVGESWFVHMIHQKGFDAFHSSEYSEGGGDFLAALENAGHEVTYIPSHEIHTRFPTDLAALKEIADVVVISDVGANSFQLAPETFSRSIPTVDKTELVRQFTAEGGGLVMIGGYLTFTGIDARGRWGNTPLAYALPVRLLDRDDRVELPSGAKPTVVSEHPATDGLDPVWPNLLGLNEVTQKPGSDLLAECSGYPLLVAGTYQHGRSAAFTSDIAPHWAPPEFVAWAGYRQLFDQLMTWVAGKES